MHQEILLPGTSTVWEYLTFHAALRMPQPQQQQQQLQQPHSDGLTAPNRRASASAAAALAVRRRVGEVVEELGLTRVAHSLIGDAFVRGLSGEEEGGRGGGWRKEEVGWGLNPKP